MGMNTLGNGDQLLGDQWRYSGDIANKEELVGGFKHDLYVS